MKLSLLRLTNTGNSPRRLSLTAYAEWTLGVLREHTQHQVQTGFEPSTGAILARNRFDPHSPDQVAFFALSEPLAEYTADRREFLGRNGSVEHPAGLGAPLSGAAGAGHRSLRRAPARCWSSLRARAATSPCCWARRRAARPRSRWLRSLPRRRRARRSWPTFAALARAAVGRDRCGRRSRRSI